MTKAKETIDGMLMRASRPQVGRMFQLLYSLTTGDRKHLCKSETFTTKTQLQGWQGRFFCVYDHALCFPRLVIIGIVLFISGNITWGKAYAGEKTVKPNSEVHELEVAIAKADPESLPQIEVRIARLLQLEPSSVSAHYLMSTLLLKMYVSSPTETSLLRQSTELAAQAYDLDHKSELGIVALASILDLSGETEKGLKLLEEAAQKGIKLGWRSHLARARLLSAGKESKPVLRELEQAFRSKDAIRELIAPFAVAVIASGASAQEALPQLETWEQNYHNIAFVHAIAAFQVGMQNYKTALSNYQAIQLETPQDKAAAISEGILLYRYLKEPTKGARVLRNALSMHLDQREESITKFHLAAALLHLGDLTEAERFAIDAIARANDRDATVVAVINAYKSAGKFKNALTLLESLNDKVPGLHMSYALQGELLSEKEHRPKEALSAYSAAITLEPSRSEYYNGRGLAYFSLGELMPALQDFETAVRVNPSDASARYNVACALARLGKSDEAIEALASALELDDRLLALAQNDKDFMTLHALPSFKAVLNGKSPLVQAAH